MTRRRNPYPGVSRVVDRHGGVRWRFRRGVVDCYLRGPYGSAAFTEDYAAALTGARPDGAPTVRQAAHGSLDWLVQRFYRSPAWAALCPSSAKERRAFWEAMREKYGALPVDRLTTANVARMAEKKAATPVAANRIIKRMRQMLAFALRQGIVTANVAAPCAVYRTRAGGFHTWTEEQVGQFETVHAAGSQARLALRLMLYTGAARADVVRLGWGNIGRDGRLRYARQKSGGAVDLRILADLDEELRRLPHEVGLFLVTAQGKPFTAAGFGNKVRTWCDAAGLPECSAHGLRKAGATALAYAGATEAEIGAFLGHKGTTEAATYVKAARRATLSDNALDKLEARRRAENVSNLPGEVGQKGA